MSTFNVRQLEDRARDVDPDLRYMALEDFQKNLNNPKVQVRNVSYFIPILFNLLSDSATEVQNQAVHSFASLVRHIDDSEVLQVVSRLYEEVEKVPNTSKFTTCVPTLALRSILTDSYLRFGKQLSRQVLDTLLPRLFVSSMTIDNIEILIDLIKSLGPSLSANELASVVSSLIATAFKESGIISKRSVTAMDVALNHVKLATENNDQQLKLFDKVVADVDAGYSSTDQSPSSTNTFFTLYQVVLGKLKQSSFTLSELSTNTIFQAAVNKLDFESIEDGIDVEDLDIDVLVLVNLIREDAMITLASLVPCVSYESFIHSYAPTVFQAVIRFVAYDPLLTSDIDAEIDADDESEIEFSDDDEIEQYDDVGDNDGLAAKLRSQAIVLLGQLLSNVPLTLPLIYSEGLAGAVVDAIGDHSVLVSNEAIAAVVKLVNLTSTTSELSRSRANSDVSMSTEGVSVSPYNLLSTKFCPEIEKQVFDNLLTSKNISRFSISMTLLESLIAKLSSSLSDQFLFSLLDRVKQFNLSLKVYPEIIKLYKVILTTYDFESLPADLLDFIFKDLAETLSDTGLYHSFISDILLVCKICYANASSNPKYQDVLNDTFFSIIAEKAILRQYPSEIRQQFLSSLTELIVNVDITSANREKAIEIFQESLNYEVTVSFTIESLIQVCEKKPELFDSDELCDLIVDKLATYLGSSDSTLYLPSLVLLDSILSKPNYVGNEIILQALSDNIFDLLLESTDMTLIRKAFTVLGHTLRTINADESYFERLTTTVVNPKMANVDDINLDLLEFLVTQICKNNSVGGRAIYATAVRTLTLRNFISARILAIITFQCNLEEEITAIEDELYRAFFESVSVPSERIIFDIHYLGCIASRANLRRYSFDEFFAILKSSADENYSLAAARAMGLCIIKDFHKYLPVLLRCFQSFSAENNAKRFMILVAIKQLLKEDVLQKEITSLRSIWDSIIQVISARSGDLTHKDVAELKLAGDVLSKITELDSAGDYNNKILSLLRNQEEGPRNEHLIYTIVVIIKQLMSSTVAKFDILIVERVIVYLPISNLELKLAIVSTLLTGLYNKSFVFVGIINEVILPRIYDELTAKEEFKKVIPMGPYKYVVDEGLEVRKLSYELISAMINVDNDKVKIVDAKIDQVRLFEMVLAKGLNDTENDIINLTILILMQLIQNDENLLTKATNQPELIASLTKIINKKLRSKASTQETESYEDTLRSTIKLSKVINAALISTSAISNEWSSYYHELKNKHHLLFSAVTV